MPELKSSSPLLKDVLFCYKVKWMFRKGTKNEIPEMGGKRKKKKKKKKKEKSVVAAPAAQDL